jgi:hypothetical protein
VTVWILAFVALALATTAAWASTHEFYSAAGNCTAVASDGPAGCVRTARAWMGLSVAVAAAAFIALMVTARHREPS